MQMIDIDGKYYKIDMDEFMKWVSESPSTERNIFTTTTLTYPSIEDEGLVEKEISENKSSMNEAMGNIRYDFGKTMLNVLFTVYSNGVGEIASWSLKDMTLGQRLVFNTFLAKDIITEVTENDNE